MAQMIKVPEVLTALDRLRVRFGVGALQVCDHWEADLCAIGVTRPGESQPLVYFSTWKQPPGRFDVALELPPEAEREHPNTSAEWHRSVDLDTLEEIVATHLGLSHSEHDDRHASV